MSLYFEKVDEILKSYGLVSHAIKMVNVQNIDLKININTQEKKCSYNK